MAIWIGIDIKNTSSIVKGISTIADTYDQYHHGSTTCERTITNSKSLGSTMKRQVSGSVKKFKDELKETKKKLKKLEEAIFDEREEFRQILAEKG